MFFIQIKGGTAFHAVRGDLEALQAADAWRKPEHALCGVDSVPLNYLTTLSAYQQPYLCARCARAAARPAA